MGMGTGSDENDSFRTRVLTEYTDLPADECQCLPLSKSTVTLLWQPSKPQGSVQVTHESQASLMTYQGMMSGRTAQRLFFMPLWKWDIQPEAPRSSYFICLLLSSIILSSPNDYSLKVKTFHSSVNIFSNFVWPNMFQYWHTHISALRLLVLATRN